MRVHVFALVLLLSGSLAPATALAGNADDTLIGNDAALMAGAQTASASSGAALHYNPAGLSDAPNGSVDVSISAYTLRLHSISQLVSSADEGSEQGAATEVLIIPTGVSFVRKLNDRLTFGFGVFTLEQSDVTFQGEAVASDGLQDTTYYLRQRRTATLYKGVVGLGLRVNRYISLGFALDFYYSDYSHSIFTDSTHSDSTTGNLVGADVRLWDLTLSEYMIGGSLGLRWKIRQHAVLGLGVTLPGVTLASGQEVSFSETYFPGNGQDWCTPSDSACHDWGHTESISSLGVQLVPARFRLGFAWLDDGFRIDADFDVQASAFNWSAATQERRPTWNMRLGGIYDFTDVVSAGLGFFTDRSPFVAPYHVGQRQQDFYGFTTGILLRKVLRLADSEDSDALVFTTAIGFRYAYGSGVIVTEVLDGSVPPGGLLPTRESDLRTHELAINLGSGVSF